MTIHRVDQDIELRSSLERGFWEMWVADHFVGMYYSLERARQAACSCYAEAMRRKYARLAPRTLEPAIDMSGRRI